MLEQGYEMETGIPCYCGWKIFREIPDTETLWCLCHWSAVLPQSAVYSGITVTRAATCVLCS